MTFIASKIFWVFLSPGNLLVLLLVLGAFLGVSHYPERSRTGRRLCFFVALLFFAIAIFPVGSWMLMPLENRFPPQKPEHIDGIVLLGGDEQPRLSRMPDRPVFLDSARRYITFAALARRYPHAKLLFSGGTPVLHANDGMAEIAKQELADLGVPVDKIMFEYGSRNTHENAVLSYDMAHPRSDEIWLLVTSAFHMPRALATFRKAGWNVLPATTGYYAGDDFSLHLQFNLGDHLQSMAIAMHEYYGLLAYWLMGYTDSLWPG